MYHERKKNKRSGSSAPLILQYMDAVCCLLICFRIKSSGICLFAPLTSHCAILIGEVLRALASLGSSAGRKES